MNPKVKPEPKQQPPQIQIITQEQAVLRALAEVQTRLGRIETLLKELKEK